MSHGNTQAGLGFPKPSGPRPDSPETAHVPQPALAWEVTVTRQALVAGLEFVALLPDRLRSASSTLLDLYSIYGCSSQQFKLRNSGLPVRFTGKLRLNLRCCFPGAGTRW